MNPLNILAGLLLLFVVEVVLVVGWCCIRGGVKE